MQNWNATVAQRLCTMNLSNAILLMSRIFGCLQFSTYGKRLSQEPWIDDWSHAQSDWWMDVGEKMEWIAEEHGKMKASIQRIQSIQSIQSTYVSIESILILSISAYIHVLTEHTSVHAFPQSKMVSSTGKCTQSLTKRMGCTSCIKTQSALHLNMQGQVLEQLDSCIIGTAWFTSRWTWVHEHGRKDITMGQTKRRNTTILGPETPLNLRPHGIFCYVYVFKVPINKQIKERTQKQIVNSRNWIWIVTQGNNYERSSNKNKRNSETPSPLGSGQGLWGKIHPAYSRHTAHTLWPQPSAGGGWLRAVPHR